MHALCAGINFLTNTLIVRANLASKSLESDKGETFTYDKLIIATGARVRYSTYCSSS